VPLPSQGAVAPARLLVAGFFPSAGIEMKGMIVLELSSPSFRDTEFRAAHNAAFRTAGTDATGHVPAEFAVSPGRRYWSAASREPPLYTESDQVIERKPSYQVENSSRSFSQDEMDGQIAFCVCSLCATTPTVPRRTARKASGTRSQIPHSCLLQLSDVAIFCQARDCQPFACETARRSGRHTWPTKSPARK